MVAVDRLGIAIQNHGFAFPTLLRSHFRRHARARGHPARRSLPSIQRFLDSRFRGNDADSNSVGRKLGYTDYEWQNYEYAGKTALIAAARIWIRFFKC
jgi:hypothetical protein